MIKALQKVFLCFVYLLLYLPIIILVLYSFNDATYSMQIKHWSLKWYIAVFNDEPLWQSASHSFILAISSSTIASALAALAAINFHFYRYKGQKTLNQLLFLLIIVPDIILAVGFLLLFYFLNIEHGFFTLLISHITFSLPFAVLVIQNQLKNVNHNIFNACLDLGASEFYAITKVILPSIKTGLLSAWLLCFTLSFDDVLISYFTAGPNYQILPLYIYSLIRSGITPEINALSTIVFMLSLIVISVAYIIPQKTKVAHHD